MTRWRSTDPAVEWWIAHEEARTEAVRTGTSFYGDPRIAAAATRFAEELRRADREPPDVIECDVIYSPLFCDVPSVQVVAVRAPSARADPGSTSVSVNPAPRPRSRIARTKRTHG